MNEYNGFKVIGSESLEEAAKQLKELRDQQWKKKQREDLEISKKAFGDLFCGLLALCGFVIAVALAVFIFGGLFKLFCSFWRL